MPTQRSALTKKSTREWVYFLGSESPKNLIKIGRASNLERRLESLRTMSSVKVFLLAAFNAPKRTEALFHHLFEEYREHGEWFRPGESLLKFLEAEYPEMLALSDLTKICANLGKQVDFSKFTADPKRDEFADIQEEWEARFHDRPKTGAYKVPLATRLLSLKPVGKL